MTRSDWLSPILAALSVVLLAASGGILLFNTQTPAAGRGVGLAVIVLLPWLLTELLKERPPRSPQQKRRK